MTHAAPKGEAARQRSYDPTTPAQRQHLLDLLSPFAPDVGVAQTVWPALMCARSDRPAIIGASVYLPSLCIVAQGAKRVTLGRQTFRYDALTYLVAGATIPVHARIIEASRTTPFLSLMLRIDTADVRALLAEMQSEPGTWSPWTGEVPLRTSPMDARLLDAVLRFLSAVREPEERRILAPAALREVIYLLLKRDQGDLVSLAAQRDHQAVGVTRALRYVHRHLFEPIDVTTLARAAGMSASSLHAAFRRATAATPIQYVKRLRLEHARELLVGDHFQAAEAAHRVGYESPSQFTRDFKRTFGLPPRQYVESAMANQR